MSIPRLLTPLLLLLLGSWPAWGKSVGASSAALRPVAANREAGFPFVRNYAPRTYGADAQNWAVLQDRRGLLYAGNNRGVLEYDGVHWRLIPTPRRTVVRSLGLDEAGRVCVGAVGEIGYLAPDAQGANRFVSLLDWIPESARTFTDVWVTAAIPGGMLFQTREYLFLLRRDRIQVVKADTTFHVAFVVGKRVFVRQREVGLQELVGDRLTLVPGGGRFARESIFTMLPLDPDGDVLIGTREDGLWRLGPGGIVPFRTPTAGYLERQALYSGLRLGDGSLALATIKGGVVLLDGQGRLEGILDRRAGIQGNNVKALCADREGGLWLALDNGLSRVAWPSPLSIHDERSGLEGTVWAMQRFQGRFYAATGQGAFVLETPGKGDDPRPIFWPLPGVGTQSLGFLPLEDRLLLASAQGLFEIRNGRTRLVRRSSLVTISMLRVREDPGLILLGMQGGLLLLRHPPGSDQWTDLGRIPGVMDDVYSLAEDAEGRFWLGTGSQGLMRLTFPGDWWRERRWPPPRVERFGPDQGLPSLMQPTVVAWKGGILAATASGLLVLDENTGRFRPEPRFAALFPDGPRAVKVARPDARGRLWLDTYDEQRGVHEAGVVIPGPGGSLAWVAGPYRRFSDLILESIQVDDDGTAWFGGPSGILRYDPSLAPVAEGDCPVLIRRVSEEERTLFGGDGDPGTGAADGLELPYRRGALRFEFAAPSFDLEPANQYQVRLDGYDRHWSPWMSETLKEYTNLPEGRYQFRVRARNVSGWSSRETTFAFRVRPPWYRTGWAILLFLASGVLAAAGGLRLGTRLLRRRNLALQHRIEQATDEIRERERLLAAQAGALERANQQLRELNEQKDQFLAVVAHDLRNPLTSILLSSQIIEEETDLRVIRRRAGLISREGAGMEALIGRFLDLSALETGHVESEPGEVSLLELLREILDRHEGPAADKTIRLEVVAEPSAGRAFADPRFMAAVLDNLVSNALKFSPRGGAVSIRIEDLEGRVRLSVQDQGPGLTEADKGRLFGRFARLSAQPTGGEKSVGLGLSIARQMVEVCGGKIWVESEPGRGATFIVEFPASPEGRRS